MDVSTMIQSAYRLCMSMITTTPRAASLKHTSKVEAVNVLYAAVHGRQS